MILDWLYRDLVQRPSLFPLRVRLVMDAAIVAVTGWLSMHFVALIGNPLSYVHALVLCAIPGYGLYHLVRWLVKTRVEDPTRVRRPGVDR